MTTVELRTPRVIKEMLAFPFWEELPDVQAMRRTIGDLAVGGTCSVSGEDVFDELCLVATEVISEMEASGPRAPRLLLPNTGVRVLKHDELNSLSRRISNRELSGIYFGDMPRYDQPRVIKLGDLAVAERRVQRASNSDLVGFELKVDQGTRDGLNHERNYLYRLGEKRLPRTSGPGDSLIPVAHFPGGISDAEFDTFAGALLEVEGLDSLILRMNPAKIQHDNV